MKKVQKLLKEAIEQLALGNLTESKAALHKYFDVRGKQILPSVLLSESVEELVSELSGDIEKLCVTVNDAGKCEVVIKGCDECEDGKVAELADKLSKLCTTEVQSRVEGDIYEDDGEVKGCVQDGIDAMCAKYFGKDVPEVEVDCGDGDDSDGESEDDDVSADKEAKAED